MRLLLPAQREPPRAPERTEGRETPSCPPRNPFVVGWLLFVFVLELGVTEAAVRERHSGSTLMTTPCWLVEDFVVAEECAPCTTFQAKTTPECGTTGFVEKISCSTSRRDEFKSCRSAMMERHLFWKFEGAVVGVAAVFACLVILRQRSLDRKALEKVRKQIESI